MRTLPASLSIAPAIILLAALSIACGKPASVGPTPSPSPAKPQDRSVSYRRDDGVWINANGWQLPQLKESESTGTTRETLNDSSGHEIDVSVTSYALDGVVMDEPFKLIGRNYGKVKLVSAAKFSRSKYVFGYMFTAQKAAFNSKTKRYEGQGMYFAFFLADEDGDGTFEAFLGSADTPISVPTWVLKE